MLNMIKMDFYRMLHMKSLYVIWIVMIAAVFFSTSMSVLDYEYIMEEEQEEFVEEPGTVNFGLAVSIPTEAGEKVTVFDQVYANLQSKFIAIFMLIFTVIFSSADLSSGYIKNIGGQVKNRGKLIFSKAIALLGYTVGTMLLYLIFQIITQKIYFGYLEWGNTTAFLKYFGTQTVLYYALLLIGMAIAIILNSNVFSMAIVICLCMNMMAIFYGFADKLLQKAGGKDFQIVEYTVTGKIALLPMLPKNGECLAALLIAAVFGIAVVLLTGQVFRKRDV